MHTFYLSICCGDSGEKQIPAEVSEVLCWPVVGEGRVVASQAGDIEQRSEGGKELVAQLMGRRRLIQE